MKRRFWILLAAAMLLSMLCLCIGAALADEVTEYDLWLGSTRVTSANKDDILGDGGKAKYDPAHNSLTLDEPIITGTYNPNDEDAYRNYEYKIFSDMKGILFIYGSYHMTEADGAEIGIGTGFSRTRLNFNGDFSFIGSENGVSGNHIEIRSGKLSATGLTRFGIGCSELEIYNEAEQINLQGETSATAVTTVQIASDIRIVPSDVIINGYAFEADGKTVVHEISMKGPGIYYNLWVGSQHVSSAIMDDILNDGGSAKYDPATETLTLNNPDIPGSYSDGTITFSGQNGQTTYDETCKIFKKGNLTIKGSYKMEDDGYYKGIYVKSGSLTLDGDFQFLAGISPFATAIDVEGNLRIISGKVCVPVKAKEYQIGVSRTGIYCSKSLIVEEGVTLIRIEGDTACRIGGLSIADNLSLTMPEDGIYKDGYIRASSTGEIVQEVIIQNPEISNFKYYNIWLGPVRVSSWNKDDIMEDGEGKARFDPETGVLTLNEPDIKGIRFTGNNTDDSRIFIKDMDITIRGSYHMTKNNASAALYVSGCNLSIEGDFSFLAFWWGIRCKNSTNTTINFNGNIYTEGSLEGLIVDSDASINFLGGSFTAISENIGVECHKATIVIEGDTDYIRCEAVAGLITKRIQTIPNSKGEYVLPVEPTGGSLIAHRVVLCKHYPVWVGETQVNVINKNDILGDGKVSYNPDDCTLTLDKPVIEGTQHVLGLSANAKIYVRDNDINITGSYHMTEADTDYGLQASGCGVTLEGDFTFLGLKAGICASGDLTLAGNITATGEQNAGVYANGKITVRDADDVTATGLQVGMFGNNGITIMSSVGRLTVEGDTYALNTMKLELVQEGADLISICNPVNGSFQTNKGILDENGNKVTRAVFGRGYSLWLMGTPVTVLNKDDILGDGKASYDPLNRKLTLNNLKIVGEYDIPTIANSTQLLYASHLNLTVSGKWNVRCPGVDYGVLVDDGNLTLDGDFTFTESDTAVCVRGGDLTVTNGGTLCAYGRQTGLKANRITLQGSESRVRMKGETYAVYLDAETDPITGQALILVPAEGTVRDHTVYVREGVIANDVMLGTKLYGIWLGTTRINGVNKNDVFGDGTASYDPETNTLTLNNPSIPNVYKDGDFTATILLQGIHNLTIRGSYDMPYGAKFGLVADSCAVTLEGSFCFRGSKGGIELINDDLILRYGTLTVYGHENYGVSCRSLDIEPGFGRLEIHSNEIALVTDYEPAGMLSLTYAALENPVFRYGETNGQTISIPDVWSVYESETSRKAVKDLVGSRLVYGQFEGTGTANDPILIRSQSDWDRLAGAVSGGLETRHIYFQQKGIVQVTRPVGTSDHPFSGFFEGGVTGSVMEVAINSGDTGAAPFAYIDGATIKNVRATGTVSGGIHCAGLVGVARGTNRIENCVVDVNVTTSKTHCGGIIGHGTTSSTTMRGCRFSGSISGATYAGTLWGWSDDGARPVITDCLDDSNSTFPIGLGLFTSQSVSNTYYTRAGKTAGTQRTWSDRGKQAFVVTAEEGVNMYPGDPERLYLVSDIEAYQTGMIVNHVFYAGEGDILDLLLDATLYNHLENFFRANDVELTKQYSAWRFTMPGEPVTITVLRRPLFRNGGEGTASEPYTIQTAAQWAELAAYIEDGYNTKGMYLKQIDDISTSVMIGTNSNPFRGIYNGGGNTLNFSVSSAPEDCAPFRNIEGASFSNLRIAGTIQTGNKWAAGLAINCYGTCTITDCRSSVVIQSSVSGDGTHAGFISVMKENSSVTFNGCIFDGAIKGSETTKCGGFVGYVRAGGSLTIRNSVSAPSAFEAGSSQNFSRSPSGTTINLENSYYLRAAANDQGRRGYSVTGNEGVRTVGYGTETASYGISGITAYGTGLVYGGTFYAGEGEALTLSLTNAGDCIEYYTVNAGTLAWNSGSWLLNMPGEDVRISAMQTPTFGSVDFTLPEALQAVGEEAFEGMKAGVVSVPDTCASVGKYAFRNCKSLIQIRLPKDCEIADTAFAGCTSLTAIFAPKGGTTETWAREHGIPFVPTDRVEIVISVDPPPVIVVDL